MLELGVEESSSILVLLLLLLAYLLKFSPVAAATDASIIDCEPPLRVAE